MPPYPSVAFFQNGQNMFSFIFMDSFYLRVLRRFCCIFLNGRLQKDLLNNLILSEQNTPFDQVFQFTKSGTLDARLLRLLWPDLARDPISAAMWSGCLSWWGTLEAALKEQNRAHLKEAIDLWESCQVDAYREELTPPATELLACARSLAKSWPGK